MSVTSTFIKTHWKNAERSRTESHNTLMHPVNSERGAWAQDFRACPVHRRITSPHLLLACATGMLNKWNTMPKPKPFHTYKNTNKFKEILLAPLCQSLLVSTPPLGHQGVQIPSPLPHPSDLPQVLPELASPPPPPTSLLFVIPTDRLCLQCLPSPHVGGRTMVSTKEEEGGKVEGRQEEGETSDSQHWVLPGPALDASCAAQVIPTATT